MKITHQSMPHVAPKTTTTTAQQPRVYQVTPPEDEDLFEKQMSEVASQNTTEDDEPPQAELDLDDPILKREVDKKMAFEKLMFLGQDRFKDIEYGGLKFKFKVLKSNDNAKILEAMQLPDGSDASYKATILGLSAALISVNDIPLEDFLTDGSALTDPLIKKYQVLSKWPAFMVTSLIALSYSVQQEVEKEFKKDFLAK